MARLPFARYLARIVGEAPAPYVVEALEWLWGEAGVRKVVRARKAHRVRNYCGFISRAFRRCDEEIGSKILIDDGQISICEPYGHGHVYIGGNVKKADVVIVESERGKRTLAFEVQLVRGSIKRNGRFVKRIRDTYVVVSLPRGDRGTGKEHEDGILHSRRSGRDRNARDTTPKRPADFFLRSTADHGWKASK